MSFSKRRDYDNAYVIGGEISELSNATPESTGSTYRATTTQIMEFYSDSDVTGTTTTEGQFTTTTESVDVNNLGDNNVTGGTTDTSTTPLVISHVSTESVVSGYNTTTVIDRTL